MALARPGDALRLGVFPENGSWFEVVVAGPVIINEKEMAIQLALQGVGIAFAVEETVADPIAAGRLVPLLERWSAPFPGYFLCYPQQRQMAPALRAFIDAVRGGMGARAPQDARRLNAGARLAVRPFDDPVRPVSQARGRSHSP